jgi:Peptidase family M23
MLWFVLWLPLLLQFAVPLALLAAVAYASTTRLTWIAWVGLTGAYVAAIGLVGLWLVLPWWLPNLYVAGLLAGIARARPRGASLERPSSVRGWLTLAALAGPALVAAAIVMLAIEAREPSTDAVDLRFPLAPGTYLVANGGNNPLVNAHLNTLNGERFRAYRGQSFGVDLVQVNRAGFRTRGWLPADPAAYAIFGAAVRAPCAGRVVAAVDGAPDMPPPEADRAHMAGNHVILDCAGTWVVLGHLERGSVAVAVGANVAALAPLGRVGNSGNTSEPHLHVHAQQPGSSAEPLGGEPVAIRLDSAYLVRNDRVTTK